MRTVISCPDSYPPPTSNPAGFIALFLLSHMSACVHVRAPPHTERRDSKEGGGGRGRELLERALKHININCSASWSDNTDTMPL